MAVLALGARARADLRVSRRWPERHDLETDDVAFLRRVARRTGGSSRPRRAADNHLPADNSRKIRRRTQPTTLTDQHRPLADHCLAAYDLATSPLPSSSKLYADAGLARQAAALRGHFYNWYDTTTLEPLRPMYVSTVDSGNLAGHLLTLAAGLHELAGHPVLGTQIFAGLADTLDVLAECSHESPEVVAETARLRRQLATAPTTISSARQLLERLIAGSTSARARRRARRRRGKRLGAR